MGFFFVCNNWLDFALRAGRECSLNLLMSVIERNKRDLAGGALLLILGYLVSMLVNAALEPAGTD